jgi:ferric-dicitrate binding protein FerR (iron transport regulator)
LNHPEHIDQLLEKFKRNACSEEELQELYNWLDQQSAVGPSYLFADDDARLLVQHRMRDAVFAAVATKPPVKAILRFRWIKYAAAAVTLIVFSTVVYMISRPRQVVVTAAYGKVEKRMLPDGSVVWLNDNSSIAYYSNFSGHRTIELQKGEAFFEVKKDAAHPFTVLSNKVSTTVKGTSFSVKMIDRTGDIKVSVVTGKVLVHKQQDTLGYLLPGQRLRFSKQRANATIDSIQNGEANARIQGELFLQNASLQEVIQWLHDHFNITVKNDRTAYKGEYYLQVKRDISLQEVIRILNLLGAKDHIQFSLHNQTVFIQ